MDATYRREVQLPPHSLRHARVLRCPEGCLRRGWRGVVTMDEVEAGIASGIDTAMLETVLAQKCAAIVDTARRAVSLGGIAQEKVQTLYFTGGSAALPALRQAFAAAFPHATPVFGDPFGSVAKGLGMRAARLYR